MKREDLENEDIALFIKGYRMGILRTARNGFDIFYDEVMLSELKQNYKLDENNQLVRTGEYDLGIKFYEIPDCVMRLELCHRNKVNLTDDEIIDLVLEVYNAEKLIVVDGYVVNGYCVHLYNV